MKTLLLFILLSSTLFSQDSLVEKKLISFRGIMTPMIHAGRFGYNFVVQGEYYFDSFNSFTLAYKEQNLEGTQNNRFDHFTYNVFLLEYRRYFNTINTIYFSPFFKYRRHEDVRGDGEGYYEYDETSVGGGITLGKICSIGKKKHFSVNLFSGFGYFFPTDAISEENSDTHFIKHSRPKNDISYRIDVRLGAFFGFDFKKKTK